MFRVPREHDGRGVVCPSCRRLLKLPAPGDNVPPLLAAPMPDEATASTTPGDTGSPDSGKQQVRMKRKRRKHRDEAPDWENEAQARPRGKRTRRRDEKSGGITPAGKLAMASGLMLLATIMIVVIFLVRMDGGTDGAAATTELPATGQVLTVPEAAEPPEADEPHTPRRTLNQFVTEARSVVTTFLYATTVEEILEVVARPGRVEEKIRRHHPDGMIDPPGLADYSQFTQMETTEAFVTVQLHTANHIARLMTFVEGRDGLKVDWESWVGWADPPMEDYIEQRPSGRHVFRIRLGSVDYYNFGFADDLVWQSFRLRSPDGEHSLFGYAERGTPTHIRVREALDSEIEKIMVEVEFPGSEDPSGRQVLVTDVISQNWTHPDMIARP